MSDFIREVDEEYRRDRAIKLLQRFQVPIAILVVGIIVGAGAWRWWTDSQVTKAEGVNDRYMAAADLLKAGKSAEAETAFKAVEADGSPGYALLARMRAAAALRGSDPEAAAKAYDAIADDEAGVPPSLRDAARLRGAMIRIDKETPDTFEKRYARFSQQGFAFSASMRELLAMAALKRGDFAAAGKYLDEIILDPAAPQALRGRAEALRGLAQAGPATPMPTQPPPATVVGPDGKPPPSTEPVIGPQ